MFAHGPETRRHVYPNTQKLSATKKTTPYAEGQIIEVVQTGYQIKDRVIRPALVRVAK
jgi:molecular chaperone GrpE (heat shock protein)